MRLLLKREMQVLYNLLDHAGRQLHSFTQLVDSHPSILRVHRWCFDSNELHARWEADPKEQHHLQKRELEVAPAQLRRVAHVGTAVGCADGREEGWTDEQYNDCLYQVHLYFSKHPVQVQYWELKRGEGRLSAEERNEEKAFYLGSPKRFKYFSYKIDLKKYNTKYINTFLN